MKTRKSPPVACEWDPRDYAVSSSTQLAWAQELIGRLSLRGNEHAVDIGCGDGKITAELARRLPAGRALGIDASPAMIEHARRHHLADRPNLEFQVMDARTMQLPADFDLAFSNAALHWVDDHPAVLRGMARVLKPGGRVLISCGGRGNAADVFHALRRVLRRQSWRPFFRGLTAPYFFYTPEQYAVWLPVAGLEPRSVRLTERIAWHEHVAAFQAWLRTTWLPYTQRVPEPRRADFVSEVCQAFLDAHPADATGRVAVGMVRLEIDALKL